MKTKASLKLAERLALNRIVQGIDTIPLLSKEMGLPNAYVRKIISNLERSGNVLIDKAQRPYRVRVLRIDGALEPSSQDQEY